MLKMDESSQLIQEECHLSLLAAKVSVVIPAKNEEQAIGTTVAALRSAVPEAQIIVVDDGSSDKTRLVAINAGATVLSHPYSKGNGAAIKTGARFASGDVIIFMDGDGQHDPADVARLILRLNEGHDLVVGARQHGSQASWERGFANHLYNKLASYMVGHPIEDLTSGFRAVRREKFKEFLHLLPNGFSYPTTSTMAFFRAGYSVAYEPIHAAKRIGQSHIRLIRDGARFFLIIFKIGTLFSPIKLFAPISFFFFLAGIGNYAYTYLTQGRFTNMSVLMFSAAAIVFLIGLVSEQITALMYKED